MAEENLKQRTTRALIWSAVEKFGVQVFAFVIGLVTARLLSPADFGMIGALAVFTLLSNTLVESGFTAALVQRKENSAGEYSATFYVNLALSGVIYGGLYVCAPLIADFFRLPELCDLSRFLFLSIIFNALSLVQNAVLTKKLAFRKLAFVNLISVALSGVISILLILFFQMTFWALAWQLVLNSAIKSALLWAVSDFRLAEKPKFKVVKELLSFSFLLLLTSVISAIVKHVYNFVIGRIYSISDLGFYSQAYKYQLIPTSIISSTLTSVAFPVLSSLKEERARREIYFRKLLRLTAFCAFPALLGLAALAHDFIEVLLGAKWLPTVRFFELLLLSAVFYPFHSLTINFLTAMGFPRLNFRLEMVKNALIILSLAVFHQSIEQMLFALLVATAISNLIDAILLAKISGIKFISQIKDIFPYFSISIFICLIIKVLNFLPLNIFLLFPLKIFVGFSVYILILKALKSKIFEEIWLFLLKKKS